MKDYFNNDTIAAISTPVGKSGIGIVRLSGKDALPVADRIFVSSNGKRPSGLPSHTLHYGWIINNAKCKMQNAKFKRLSGRRVEFIDEVLLTVMHAPKTYTREDIVEINCHSGIVVLKKILELVLKMGARLASPGEFTKRAYLSGRIDLTQAEAVLDVVNSRSQKALQAALGQLRGGLSRKIKSLRRNLLDILTQLELSIDFSDEDVEPLSRRRLLKKMEVILQDLEALLDTAEKGTILREGISCAICGKPNVGKSSLLNALLRKDRAIVTSIPGTTRDTLEETIDVYGIPLRLIDTAGIVKAHNQAEKEAIKRGQRCIKESSLVLFVLDASQRLTSEDRIVFRKVSHKPAFIVLNKQDLPTKITQEEVKKAFDGRKVLGISALRGAGLDRLEREVTDSIWQGKTSDCKEVMVTNIRHKQALREARKSLERAIRAEIQGYGTEIISLEIKEAQRFLSEIIGEISCEDILERIFSEFCIGK